MNLQQITKIISREYNLPKTLSENILKTILETIRQELKQNRIVRIRNFGTFQTRKSHGKLRAKFNDSKNFFK